MLDPRFIDRNAVSDGSLGRGVFESDDALTVIQCIQTAFGDEPQFLWPKSPKTAVFKRKDSGKWYAALIVIPKRKLGIDSDGDIEILNLKTEPDRIESIIDGRSIFPGYHMNKSSWFSVCLDGSVPIEEILRLLKHSHIAANR